MDPTKLKQYLEVAREGGAAAFEILPDGGIRVTMAPDAARLVRRPGAREVEERLGQVDEDVLYGSAGGAL